MELNNYLADRLKEVLTEGTWVTGTNFKDQISKVLWKDAVKKFVDLNSIADLTFHVTYYIAGIVKVLEGGPLDIRDAYSFTYEPVTSASEWQHLIDNFTHQSERLITLVEKMTNKQLVEDFIDPKYGTYQRNIDVLIEHTYYHLGQIPILKKLIKNQEYPE